MAKMIQKTILLSWGDDLRNLGNVAPVASIGGGRKRRDRRVLLSNKQASSDGKQVGVLWITIEQLATSPIDRDFAESDGGIFRFVLVWLQPGIIALTSRRIAKGLQVKVHFIGNALVARLACL